jgi:hypothetical protein
MSHFRDSDYEDNCLLGCDAMYSGMQELQSVIWLTPEYISSFVNRKLTNKSLTFSVPSKMHG